MPGSLRKVYGGGWLVGWDGVGWGGVVMMVETSFRFQLRLKLNNTPAEQNSSIMNISTFVF